MDSPALPALINAFVLNDAELTREQVDDVLREFNSQASTLALAELERNFDMTFDPRTRIYSCPRIADVFHVKARYLRGGRDDDRS